MTNTHIQITGSDIQMHFFAHEMNTTKYLTIELPLWSEEIMPWQFGPKFILEQICFHARNCTQFTDDKVRAGGFYMSKYESAASIASCAISSYHQNPCQI